MTWRDLFQRQTLKRHPTKRDAFRVLKEKGVPVKSVIDVGVLHGTPDLMWGYPDVPHLLIEPVADFASTITSRYEAAGVPHQLILAAASDKKGELTLHLKKDEAADITHARETAPADASADAGTVKVTARPLDDMLADLTLPTPHLLKIDVDGAELQVLKGAEKALESCSIVCIETGVSNLFKRSVPLVGAGFGLFDIVDLCYYDDRLAQVDLIFIRKQLIADLGIELFKDGFDDTLWQSL